MSKIQYSYSFFDEDSNSYWIELTYLGKTYGGTAKLHEEDVSTKSSFFGFEIAELRAKIKVEKSALQTMRNELKTLTQLYNQLTQMREFNPRSCESKAIRKQIAIKESNYQEQKYFIDSLKKEVYNKIRMRDKIKEVYTKEDNG